MSRTLHARFAVALLREAFAGACTLHLAYRIDHEREVIHGWEPRRSANDPAPSSPIPSPEMAPSWIISPDPSEMLIRGFGLDPGQPSGLYVSSPVIARNAIILSELPRTRATLLLRLLGTGTLLEEALAEQAALPADTWERRAARAALLAVTAAPVPMGETRKSPVLHACRRAYETWAKAIEG